MKTPSCAKMRPILYQPALVGRILDDEKTETRRLAKPQPTHIDGCGRPCVLKWDSGEGVAWRSEVRCPYGQPGDVLWVREQHYRWGLRYEAGLTKKGRPSWRFRAEDSGSRPKVLFELPHGVRAAKRGELGWHKRPGIFLPKGSERVRLVVEAVRVERVQSITEAGARAEGVGPALAQGYRKKKRAQLEAVLARSLREGFQWLWLDINGGASWTGNAWVWVITFRRLPRGEWCTP